MDALKETAGYIWDEYTALRVYPILRGQDRPPELRIDDSDKMVRFCVLVSERTGSPNLKVRINECANALKLRPALVSLIVERHSYFTRMLFSLFRLRNDYNYEMWLAQKMSFHMMTSSLLDPSIDPSTAQNIRKNLPNFAKELEQLEASIFPNELVSVIVNTGANVDFATNYAQTL